jgi:predicted transposase/invertase (TIGR01784 family)
MKYKLLSPLADDVFKGIFADRRNIDNLAAFLRPIVHLPDEELNHLTIVDPYLKRLFKRDKQGILDVKVITTSGKVINIEVQIGHFAAIHKRILYYLAKLIWEQLRSGDNYDRIQQIIIVLICDQIIPEEQRDRISPPQGLKAVEEPPGGTGQYLTSFLLQEEGGGKIFTNMIKIITIELPKIPRKGTGDGVWPWARFFTCEGEEEYDMLAEEYPEVRKVVGELKKLSWGERRRLIAEQEEIWRKDRMAMADDAKAEGKAIGIEEGRAVGREEGKAIGIKEGRREGIKEGRKEEWERAYQEKLEIARKLKTKGLSVELIADSLKLPPKTIKGL